MEKITFEKWLNIKETGLGPLKRYEYLSFFRKIFIIGSIILLTQLNLNAWYYIFFYIVFVGVFSVLFEEFFKKIIFFMYKLDLFFSNNLYIFLKKILKTQKIYIEHIIVYFFIFLIILILVISVK